MNEAPDEGSQEVEIDYYPTKYDITDDKYYRTKKRQVFFVRRFYGNLISPALRKKQEDTIKTIIKVFTEDIYDNREYVLNQEYDGFII